MAAKKLVQIGNVVGSFEISDTKFWRQNTSKLFFRACCAVLIRPGDQVKTIALRKHDLYCIDSYVVTVQE